VRARMSEAIPDLYYSQDARFEMEATVRDYSWIAGNLSILARWLAADAGGKGWAWA